MVNKWEEGKRMGKLLANLMEIPGIGGNWLFIAPTDTFIDFEKYDAAKQKIFFSFKVTPNAPLKWKN